MLDIQDLERRWLRYKIKSYLPYAIIALAVIIITIIITLFVDTTKKEIKTVPKVEVTHKQKLPKLQKKPQKKQVEVIVKKIEEPPHQKPKEEKQLRLQPSMNFMQSLEKEEQEPFYKADKELNKAKKKPKLKKRKVVKTTVVKEEYIDIQPKKKEIKQIINIERRDSQNDIQEILTRFKKNSNPALSLFVAKKYYELGNYKQAYNYALITNNINHNIEESWLIFAKSLVKLNKKEMAIKTLRKYISYSHSGNAKILLNEIQTGKFQ